MVQTEHSAVHQLARVYAAVLKALDMGAAYAPRAPFKLFAEPTPLRRCAARRPADLLVGGVAGVQVVGSGVAVSIILSAAFLDTAELCRIQGVVAALLPVQMMI